MDINSTETDTIRKFKTILLNSFPGNPFEMRLFGSKARRDSSDDSDIDLLIIFESGSLKLINKIYEITTELMLNTNINLSPKVITRQEFESLKNNQSVFLKNVLRDGYIV